MATHLPNALIAADIERDAGMTNPGTSACLPAGLGALCQMFDNHIAQLGKLKETALINEQELSRKVSSLEQEKSERDDKIRRLEHENFLLKKNAEALGEELAQPAEDWKVKYEEIRKENEKLQKELILIQKERKHATICSNCNAGPESGLCSPQISTEEELPVTMEHKLYLSSHIPGNDFKHVLRHLSVPDTEVTNIYDANPKDPKECCIQGLIKWKSNKGKKATVWALIQGLLKTGLRDVAEEFCEKNGLHQLHKKIVSLVDPESEEEVQFRGADAPSSPTACPSDASPLHVILWPHLRHPACNCLDDLDQELSECDSFTTNQLQKLSKSKLFQNDPQFLKACEAWNTLDVLNEVARRSSATQDRDQSPVMMRLGKMLRRLKRKDIRRVFISFLQSGVIGPSVDEKMYIRDLCYRTLNNIGRELSKSQPSDMHDWRCLASDIHLSETISLFEKKELPGMEILQAWKTSNEATVGKLYEWAVKETRWDIVKIMENSMSNEGI